MNQKQVTIYTTNSCAYCVMVKRWLDSKSITYDEVNIDNHPNRAQEAVALSGQMAVPVTVITNSENEKEIVVGYNLSKLAPALV